MTPDYEFYMCILFSGSHVKQHPDALMMSQSLSYKAKGNILWVNCRTTSKCVSCHEEKDDFSLISSKSGITRLSVWDRKSYGVKSCKSKSLMVWSWVLSFQLFPVIIWRFYADVSHVLCYKPARQGKREATQEPRGFGSSKVIYETEFQKWLQIRAVRCRKGQQLLSHHRTKSYHKRTFPKMSWWS